MALQTHPVGDALDQTAGTGAKGVVLEAVDDLVRDDAGDLVGEARLGPNAGDVPQGEVDLLVVAVEVRPRGVGDAGHVPQDEGHGPGGRGSGGGARGGGVQVAEDVADGRGEDVGGVDGGEEGDGATVGEVSDLEADRGDGKVLAAAAVAVALIAWLDLVPCRGNAGWGRRHARHQH